MIKFINELMNEIIDGYEINKSDAESIFKIKDEEAPYLIGCASIIRNHFHGNKVNLCAILNAKSGNCVNDCAFCAQSGHNRASVDIYPLVSAEKIIEAADQARQVNASCFGIVTSGETISGSSEQDTLIRAVEAIKSRFPERDVGVSIGKIDRSFLKQLISAGLDTVHHNLETSARHYDNICTTRSYKEKTDFIGLLKEENVKICSGGILGLGENHDDRIDMAFMLRSFNVDRVPLNFLNPLPGTKLENMKPETPLDYLKSIAFFRFVLPKTHIQICGGRELNFRSLQSAVFWAGANGMMVGNYLTTAGQDPGLDLQMVEDLNLHAVCE